jgi:hypothetical protein
METEWEKTFHDRMQRFEGRRQARTDEISISIKIRVVSGCFHREHSPRAYAIVDKYLSKSFNDDMQFIFEEHESGPELLVYVTLGLGLAKSLIDLITVIIKARSEGIKKGDRPSAPLELIVRRVNKGLEFHEEIVLRVENKDLVDSKKIEQHLNEAISSISKKERETDT